MQDRTVSESSSTGLKATLYLYSMFIQILEWLILLTSLVVPKSRIFIRDRKLRDDFLGYIESQRKSKRYGVLFFCSSAGEYEQAKPLIARFEERGDVYVQILFFSESGIKYAGVRNEKHHYFKSPLDIIWKWRQVFSASRPDICVVVRHELWPAFLYLARSRSYLVCIDGTETPSLRKRKLGRYVKSQLLFYFHKLYVADRSDEVFFNQILGQDADRLMVCGDTKYDRVRERVRDSLNDSGLLRSNLDSSFGKKNRFIVGSAWHKDITETFKAYKRLLDKGLIKGWQLVVAPHDIREKMVSWIVKEAHNYGLPVSRFSKLTDDLEPFAGEPPVLIVDEMGILAELYGCASIALVGGALHHKVHNVLEPACRGLYLAFGPLYENSKEAVLLVGKQLVTVVNDSYDIEKWWCEKAKWVGDADKELLKEVDNLCGAADLIFSDLEKVLCKRESSVN